MLILILKNQKSLLMNIVPIDVVIYERKKLHKMMIEDFMIAANEAVAEFVQDFLDKEKNQQMWICYLFTEFTINQHS